jgi:hypothetical protein
VHRIKQIHLSCDLLISLRFHTKHSAPPEALVTLEDTDQQRMAGIPMDTAVVVVAADRIDMHPEEAGTEVIDLLILVVAGEAVEEEGLCLRAGKGNMMTGPASTTIMTAAAVGRIRVEGTVRTLHRGMGTLVTLRREETSTMVSISCSRFLAIYSRSRLCFLLVCGFAELLVVEG